MSTATAAEPEAAPDPDFDDLFGYSMDVTFDAPPIAAPEPVPVARSEPVHEFGGEDIGGIDLTEILHGGASDVVMPNTEDFQAKYMTQAADPGVGDPKAIAKCKSVVGTLNIAALNLEGYSRELSLILGMIAGALTPSNIMNFNARFMKLVGMSGTLAFSEAIEIPGIVDTLYVDWVYEAAGYLHLDVPARNIMI
jgi:hypothetical protein